MMIVDDILNWARERGYTAVYGSAEQVNEMLNNTPFADSKDGTVVVMHLVTDSATVDGRDCAVVAVYFASLCDFDFDGEALLPEQERLKGIGKELLNDIRTGNVMTYDNPRWQYGYDDYADNVTWVCLRVTITASAADCVPVLPPTPPPTPTYDLFCPQVLHYRNVIGYPNPAFAQDYNLVAATIATPPELNTEEGSSRPLVVGRIPSSSWNGLGGGVIDENYIQRQKDALSHNPDDRKMKPETEQWLRDRIGWWCETATFFKVADELGKKYQRMMIAGTSALHCETKEVYIP